MAQWQAEKPSYDSNSRLAGFNHGDLVLFQFAANGDDGDSLIKAYRAHAFPIVTAKGRNTTFRYCPRANDGGDCTYCAQGHTEIKERMAMWMYVYNFLHTQMPTDKNYPLTPFEGANYFNEEVLGFRLWQGSAWKESPWLDINKLFEMYKGLHNFVCQLQITGRDLGRRYKVFAMPNSGALPPELYERAKQECGSIREMLINEMASPVTVNPAAGTVAAVMQPMGLPPMAAPIQINSVQPVTLPGVQATAPPPLAIPSIAAPTVSAPTGLPEPIVTPQAEVPDPVAEAPVAPAPTAPVTDEKRPLKALF